MKSQCFRFVFWDSELLNTPVLSDDGAIPRPHDSFYHGTIELVADSWEYGNYIKMFAPIELELGDRGQIGYDCMMEIPEVKQFIGNRTLGIRKDYVSNGVRYIHWA